MAGQGQTTVQVQTQQQLLSPQHVMTAKLTELPLEGLKDRINKELEDNQWLEKRDGSGASAAPEPPADSSTSTGAEDSYDDNDDIPRANNGTIDFYQREQGNRAESFYDILAAQIGEYDLNAHEREVLRYLIGSLGEDGLLHESTQQIANELDIYQDVPTTASEVEHLLTDVIQQMEPAGVGARDLQECLLLQVRRNTQSQWREQILVILTRYWDDFSHTRWNRIQANMKLSEQELENIKHSIRRLTPRPGGSVGSKPDDVSSTITPDFFVTIDDDGHIHLSLNEGDLPELKISDDAEITLNMPTVTKSDKEALRYIRGQVSNAQLFLTALAQRRDSMLRTMKAIIRLQRPYFRTGDETLLKPMKLEDVANLTQLDISTISRVTASKYVETPEGTQPLRWFFSAGATQHGEEVSIRNMHAALRQLVDNEDKRRPLSDEKLAQLLTEQGFDVARRTVAKYRTQLGIPESRLR